jgi:hypothetical protein
VPMRYQLKVHQSAMISTFQDRVRNMICVIFCNMNIGLLITADGVIITGAEDGTIGFFSLESLVKVMHRTLSSNYLERSTYNILKFGEHRFPGRIERIMFIRGEDLLVKFHNDLQLLTYTLV